MFNPFKLIGRLLSFLFSIFFPQGEQSPEEEISKTESDFMELLYENDLYNKMSEWEEE